MIVLLVSGGELPSASSHLMAGLLESALREVHAHAVDLDLGLSPGRGDPLDRGLGVVLEAAPDVLVLTLAPRTARTVLDLCRRVRRISPATAIVLGGAEAALREGELVSSGLARAVVPPGAPLELLAVVSDLLGARPPGGVLLLPSSRGALGSRLDVLVATASSTGEDGVVVEPLFGGETTSLAHRHEHPSATSLTVEDAASMAAALLRAGLGVRLLDPPLLSSRARIDELFAHLSDAPLARLLLDLSVEILDPALVDRLIAAGPRRLGVDLTGFLLDGELPARARAPLEALARGGVALEGTLGFGLPGTRHEAVLRALDFSIAAGVESLSLHRLSAPPGSPLRSLPASARLIHDPEPPYAVLAHAAAPFEEILRTCRLASALDGLRPLLAGSGLLRALAGSGGLSPAEVIEGFADRLAKDGRDLLGGLPAEPLDGPFAAYLEGQVGLDLASCLRGEGHRRLVRAPSLSLHWGLLGQRLLADDATGRVARIGRCALGLVDRFDRPRSLDEVCEAMVSETPAPRRPRVRRGVHRTLERLVSMGFLLETAESPASRAEGSSDGVDPLPAPAAAPFVSLEEFEFHLRMLSDNDRLDAYGRAIARAAGPGVHAVEIGTGTGILAVLAARTGATVTAIERFSVLSIARAVAEGSGLSERIRFLQGHSDTLEVDEPGDLLISEIVGNRIFNEGLLETTLDARRRFLRPGARLIPQRIEVHAEIGFSGRFDSLEAELLRIGRLHDVPLEPMQAWFRERLRAGKVVWELSAAADDFRPLAPPTRVVRLDLRRLESPDFVARALVRRPREGVANAVLLSFRLELQPGIVLSTLGTDHALHWCKPVHMLSAPVAIRPGEPLEIELRYDPIEELSVRLGPPAGVVQIPAQGRRRS
jgi:precorrin-6B methylase 2